jgi:hypothetical protein
MRSNPHHQQRRDEAEVEQQGGLFSDCSGWR